MTTYEQRVREFCEEANTANYADAILDIVKEIDSVFFCMQKFERLQGGPFPVDPNMVMFALRRTKNLVKVIDRNRFDKEVEFLHYLWFLLLQWHDDIQTVNKILDA